jgi:hypothetical protein
MITARTKAEAREYQKTVRLMVPGDKVFDSGQLLKMDISIQ